MEKGKDNSEEIDLVEIVRSLWARRWFVAKVAGVFVFFGLLAALFGQTKYTASTVIVPQIGQGGSSGGNLQGLAAMAGINLGSTEQGELIPPTVYPMVVGSVPYQKDLMHSAVNVAGSGAPVAGEAAQVTLLDYFTAPEYRRFSLWGTLKKYTIGLPGVIVRAIGGKKSEESAGPLPAGIEPLSAAESECIKALSGALAINVDVKSGHISLSATMPEALMAAQTAARMRELLQEYVTRFKVQKVQANLEFIEARWAEVKADFELKQRALAAFQDANRDISSAVARTRESALLNEYNLAFSIYSELSRQREQASIKVKEDTPIFAVVEPVTVPREKSAPRRAFLLTVSLVLGLMAGAGAVFVSTHAKRLFRF